MKKFIAILLTLAVVLAFGAACTESGPSYSVDSDGNLTINEPIVLRFAAPEGKFEAEIEKFKVGFKKLYPEVTIKFEPIAGEWTSQLLMQLRNGSAPDKTSSRHLLDGGSFLLRLARSHRTPRQVL